MFKKIILLNTLFFISLGAEDIQYNGNLSFEYKKINYKNMLIKNNNQKSIEVNIEVKKYIGENLLFTKIEVLRDIDDKNRKYHKINELYYKKEFDNYDLKIGKDIKYWGSLELYNITDIYNKKNIINNPSDKDKKLGTSGITFSYYMQNDDSISFIINEDKTLKNDLASYLKYSGSRDDIGARDFSYIINSKDNNFLTYHTLLIEDSIYKLEYLYSLKNKNYESALGLEHTLYSFISKKDLGLILEYYKSDNKNRTYKNDIFTALRINFNNESSSDILAGIIRNMNTKKTSYSLEYNTRLDTSFKTKINYIKNDDLSMASFKIAYHF